VSEWLDLDWPGGYQARGGHPTYGEHDIQYRFNSHGYRCPEFDTSAETRIVSIGCSYVMGIGLPECALFHERFAQRLRNHRQHTVVNWNLGQPGFSNDYICRLLFLAVGYLDPHVVLVNFTHACRREYVSFQNTLLPYYPGVRRSDLIRRDLYKHLDALSSPFDDAINLFRNYKAIAALLSNRFWLCSTIKSDIFDDLRDHMNDRVYVGCLETMDLARDHAHPGARSHDSLLERYWERFLALESASACLRR
jgi:hypothetical protein